MKLPFLALALALPLGACAHLTQASCDDAAAKAQQARATVAAAQIAFDAACATIDPTSATCIKEQHDYAVAAAAYGAAIAAVDAVCATLPGVAPPPPAIATGGPV